MNTHSQVSGPKTNIFKNTTIAYIIATLIGAICLGFFDPEGKPIDPNEWGDVLSGVFSPLAFLWLVYASLSQRTELELQRNELAQNNDSQVKQFNAMTSQAEALIEQVNLMKLQAEVLSKARHQAEMEIDVWSRWYLAGLRELHNQIIDYAAHLMRDINPPVSEQKAEWLFSLDHLQGIKHAELGLPKLYNLATETQEMVLDLLIQIALYRRMADNFKYRARTNGAATADDIKQFCEMANNLAMTADKTAAHGLHVIEAVKAARSKQDFGIQ